MKKCAIAAMATIPLLAACYPMEQAPLVYASKATVGVGISAGTSDNPGLEMILGYKATDVALVPVAVAKYCSDRGWKNCENEIYKIEIISGKKVDKSTGDSIRLMISQAEIEQRIEKNKTDALIAEQDLLVKDQSRVIARDQYQKELDDLLAAGAAAAAAAAAAAPPAAAGAAAAAPAVAPSPVPSARISKLNELLAELNAQGLQKSKIDADIAAKKDQVASAFKLYDAATKKVKELNDQLSNDISGERGDSLSVYGTFGGSSNATTDSKDKPANASAGLNGSKVFATGIAAQNLSEYQGATDCLRAINNLALALPANKVDERTNLITSANVICAKPTAK